MAMRADQYFYLENTDYKGLVGSYAALKALNLVSDEDKGKSYEGGEIERNHLIPGSFFKNGPPETKHLYDWVPTLALQRKEHRGSSRSGSFHYMKVFGMNDYLKSKGLSIANKSFSSKEVEAAVTCCREWYAKIGMDFVVAAIDEFYERLYKGAALSKRAEC